MARRQGKQEVSAAVPTPQNIIAALASADPYAELAKIAGPNSQTSSEKIGLEKSSDGPHRKTELELRLEEVLSLPAEARTHALLEDLSRTDIEPEWRAWNLIKHLPEDLRSEQAALIAQELIAIARIPQEGWRRVGAVGYLQDEELKDSLWVELCADSTLDSGIRTVLPWRIQDIGKLVQVCMNNSLPAGIRKQAARCLWERCQRSEMDCDQATNLVRQLSTTELK